MRRPSPQRQQGFGLLVFVIITSVIAFSLVIGYSGVLTRSQANKLESAQKAYLEETQTQLLSLYARNAYFIDQVSMSNTATVEQLLTGANVRMRYGLQAALSRVLTSTDGLPYRVVAIWLPTEADGTNPPDLNTFISTGKFNSCSNMSDGCPTRQYLVFDSLDIERNLQKQTVAHLTRIALKAQSYFKARLLLDPEKNVSINYFRAPTGTCAAMDDDLECLDTYTPLTQVQAGALTLTRTAQNLRLSNEELLSGWGLPIEASNLTDSVTDDSPYTMAFRAATPSGTFLTIKAVQQL